MGFTAHFTATATHAPTNSVVGPGEMIEFRYIHVWVLVLSVHAVTNLVTPDVPFKQWPNLVCLPLDPC